MGFRKPNTNKATNRIVDGPSTAETSACGHQFGRFLTTPIGESIDSQIPSIRKPLETGKNGFERIVSITITNPRRIKCVGEQPFK